MNQAQELWWNQAKSDFRIYEKLVAGREEPCQVLHYLQMTTEKLSKAYLWRTGIAPPKVHTGFVRFMRALASRNEPDLTRIAGIFGFGVADDFDTWVRGALPLAYRVMNSAPAEANDGPNPEYPWPHANPANAPTSHAFQLWDDLFLTRHGEHLRDFVKSAVAAFPAIA